MINEIIDYVNMVKLINITVNHSLHTLFPISHAPFPIYTPSHHTRKLYKTFPIYTPYTQTIYNIPHLHTITPYIQTMHTIHHLHSITPYTQTINTIPHTKFTIYKPITPYWQSKWQFCTWPIIT
jgi:hypothetical protein